MKGSKLDGICEFYDMDGNLEQRVNFKEGNLDGFLETYIKGELSSKRSFKEGYLDGPTELFDETGSYPRLLISREIYVTGFRDSGTRVSASEKRITRMDY